ncbi:MAG: HAD family phosphatase [Clostridia bacterium]|nr:HAD family phosphatase [Clostridia bacterium]
MIKNMVFDFGQVLVRFEPSYMVGRYITDPQDASLLEQVIFDRLYWDRLDAGTISDEDVIAACKTRIPSRLWNVTETIYYNWIYNIPEIEGMDALIQHIRQQYGVRVFLLSNISTYFADHADEIPILRHLDGYVFSSVCGKVKPDRAIYEHLCNTHGLCPAETIFIDDRAENIAGAQDCGIAGYVFDGNVATLRDYLDRILAH